MYNQSLRRAALVLALPAFMAGAAALPASASSYDDDEKKKITVKVCKEVKEKDHDYKSYGYDEYDAPTFKIKVWTDKKEKRVYLEDGECEKFHLKYDDYKKVSVKEYDIPDGYKFEKVKCFDKHGKYYPSYYDKTCKVKDHYVKIIVVNKEKDKKDHDY